MSWVFRKIFRLGPIKSTLSKEGVGMSWGIPGFRVGISANGKKYITLGIPGTGIYFTKYFSNHNVFQEEQPLPSTNQTQRRKTKNEKSEPWWKQKHL